jgi:protein-arginine deiminase
MTTPHDTPAEVWIRADTNRDGRIDEADEAAKTEWTPGRGAIFLANLDDDGRRFSGRAPDGRHLTDIELTGCSDASDETVNGDADVDDLAKLRARVPASARSATVRVNEAARDRVRLFVAAREGKSAADWSPLNADGSLGRPGSELLLLGLEGRDILRDESWDGRCWVTLTVELADGRRVSDSVVLKLAPLLFVHDLLPLRVLYAADPATSVFPEEAPYPVGRDDPRVAAIRERIERTQAPFRRDLLSGLERAGLGAAALELIPSLEFRPNDPDLDAQIQRSADFSGGALGQSGIDVWPQDIMQPSFMTMPGPEGQHVMWVWLRSPARNGKPDGTNPLRYPSRVVFTHLLGPGCAAVQHFGEGYEPVGEGGLYSSFDMCGNHAVVPPYTHGGWHYPQGRKLIGTSGDPALDALLEAQGYQRPIYLDSSWLKVGHVDEFISFVESETKRGWTMLVADPALAIELLREEVSRGRGEAPLFSDLEVAPGIRDPGFTIADAIADERVVEGTAKAIAGVDAAVAILRRQVGLADAEIVRLPVLFRMAIKDLAHRPVEPLLPNAVNLVNTGRGVVLVAKQHGPIVPEGDVFAAAVEARLAPLGITVHWVEDLGYAHPAGEVHCATNVLRDLSGAEPWWLEGPVS